MDNEIYTKLLSLKPLLEMAMCDYMRTITMAEAQTIGECAKALNIPYDCATCAGSRIAVAKRLFYALDAETKKRAEQQAEKAEEKQTPIDVAKPNRKGRKAVK